VMRAELTPPPPQVREGAERAIATDPGEDLAYHMLGRWHNEIVRDVMRPCPVASVLGVRTLSVYATSDA
jgi:hypothetical protein